MKKHMMSVRHNPPESYGDCFRTCIACLLDYDDPLEVPHFVDGINEGEEFDRTELNNWLENIGFGYILIPWNVVLSEDSTSSDFLKLIKPQVGLSVFILSGQSPRNVDHCVIANADGIIHDPSPQGGKLIGPCKDGFYWTEFITVLPE